MSQRSKCQQSSQISKELWDDIGKCSGMIETSSVIVVQNYIAYIYGETTYICRLLSKIIEKNL